MRHEISTALYLLANYFRVIQEIMKARLRDDLAAEDSKWPTDTALRLQAIRETLFGKLTVLLLSIEEHFKFQHWEPNIGGPFPKDVYEDMVARMKR